MLALLIPVGLVVLLTRWPIGQRKASPVTEIFAGHEEIFLRAMQSRAPTAILAVAKAFDAQGCDPSYSERLRQRARLPGRSIAWHRQVESIFRKALASDNPEAVKAVAIAFASQGLTHSSRMLFELSRALEMSQELAEVEMKLEEEEQPSTEEAQATEPEPEPEPETKTRIADEGTS
jgi:hypothetical protein